MCCLVWLANESIDTWIAGAGALSHLMEGVGLPQVSISGMFMNPVTRRWSLMNDVNVNYIAYFKKKLSVPV